jgi:catecholate siderophore receptor
MCRVVSQATFRLAAVLLAGLIVGSAAPQAAQAAGAQAPGAAGLFVRGTIVDPSGAPIPNATVSVEPPSGGTPQTAVTDFRGEFALPVPPGTHLIRAQVDGFSPVVRRIEAGRAAQEAVIALGVSSFRESVVVAGAENDKPSVVSSATRTATPLRDVPQAVSVASRQLMDDQRMSSMADVVRYMPGVGIAQGEGNRDTPILRGQSTTADFFVDGVRDDVQYFRDVYNVDRVEALKGPNAMIFGRGGAGGVINRVTRQANWSDAREVSLQFGSWDNKRFTADLGGGLNERFALRATAMYENSDSYRDGVGVERYGINPTLGLRLGDRTTFSAGYEHFRDERTADRGIPSFEGRPVATDARTFFGNPSLSESDAEVNLLTAVLEHRFTTGVRLRSRTTSGDYDKMYQNVFPGAVNAAGTLVNISGYNNAMQRQNLFNQTDVVLTPATGRVRHTLVVGTEFGRQVTDAFRQTGYFTALGPNVTTIQAPLLSPTVSSIMEFRQSATDADNHGVAIIAAVYAQDQVELSRHVQAVVGLRLDSFRVDFTNSRTGALFEGDDLLVSPRAGLIVKPVEPVSLYGSYSVSYLPRAGEQLTSLSLSTQSLDPEEFHNYEVGAKWEVVPSLAFTAAVYRLNRGNVVVPDPGDPTRSLLVDGARTNGLEVEINGSPAERWSIAGGYAYQDGKVLESLSASAPAGARLPQLPKHSFSLWNKVDVTERFGVGLGVIRRGDSLASTDNTVTLPGYVRVDTGVFLDVTRQLRLQANVENLFDEEYYPNAHNNNNITPGAPRLFRVSLITRF